MLIKLCHLQVCIKAKNLLECLKSVIKMAWIHIVGPILDPNCLQKVSADDTGKHFLKIGYCNPPL